MKVPLVLETVQGGCSDSSENPAWMLEVECACHMSYAFIGLECVPIFRRGIHIGEHSFELECLGTTDKGCAL